eukprot:COSAG02_NODE_11296_length_1753_cov_1.850665_1_plen_31_part_10
MFCGVNLKATCSVSMNIVCPERVLDRHPHEV